jgi:four helix bundle protein
MDGIDRRPGTGDGRRNGERYKFQRLQIYQLGLDYVDQVYRLTHGLPRSETFNLGSQLERASTSVVLNIAEGSTGQTNPEQARFLGLALRSLMESVACLDLIERHNYASVEELAPIRELGHELFMKIQAMRNSLNKVPRAGFRH